MAKTVSLTNGQQSAGRHTSMEKIHKKFTTLKEKWLVKVQSNLESETIRFPSAGILRSNRCQRVRWLKFYAQPIWIREVAETTLDKVVLPGLRKVLISLMNLKSTVAYNNSISQRMTQLSQEDVYLLFLTSWENNLL